LPVVFDVGLQLFPQIVHILLHVVLECGELLQVPVPHLVLPTLELGPGNISNYLCFANYDVVLEGIELLQVPYPHLVLSALKLKNGQIYNHL
jgi:hypothetical protein